MAIVSSTDGSLTITGWKRRSRAASFSIYWRYSSSVVAPIQCSSPLASIGFNIFPASMAPSVLPAPTMVCNSSIKRMILPSLFFTSSRTAFRRSSNSPLYFAPATRAPISSAKIVLSFSPSAAVSECDGLLCTQALSCGSQTFQHGYIAVGIGVNMDRMYTSLLGCFSK